MAQPLTDTLRMTEALAGTGMKPEKAKGVARALETELGRNVAARSEVEAGFEALRMEMGTRFAAVDARFVELTSEMKALRERLDALAGQIKFGATVFAATMAVVVGMIAVLHAGEPSARPTPTPPPVVVYAVPWPNGSAPDMAGRPASIPPAPVPPPASGESPRQP